MADEIDDIDLDERKGGFWKTFMGEPCVRDTYLYSLTGGLVVGTLNFMFTSNVKMSNVRGLGTFAGTMGIFWVYCRYNYFKERKDLERISATIAEKAQELAINPDPNLIPKDGRS